MVPSVAYNRIGPEGEYNSPWLPPWLKWKDNKVLHGIPGPEDKSCEITVLARYQSNNGSHHLCMTFLLTVSDPSKEGELLDSGNEDGDEQSDQGEGGHGGEGAESDSDDDTRPRKRRKTNAQTS